MSSKEGGMGGCSAKADRGWGVLFNRIKSGTFLKVLLRLVIKETAVQHLKKKKKRMENSSSLLKSGRGVSE